MPTIIDELKKKASSVSTSLKDSKKTERQVFSEKQKEINAIKDELEQFIKDIEQREIKCTKREISIQREAERLTKLKNETRELLNRYQHYQNMAKNI